MIEIEHFQQALIEELNQLSGLTDKAQIAGSAMADKLLKAELVLNKYISSPATSSLEVLGQLNDCANSICELSHSRQTLARFILQKSHQLDWYQKVVEDNVSFMRGHANTQLIGPKGLFFNSELMIGVSLMAPHLTYPDHNHPPEEIYIVLSEGQWWQQGEHWFSPGVQGYVYNPENIVHAMASKDKPLLAIWCLNL